MALMAVFVFSCRDHPAKTGSMPSPEPEEYEVYSFLINPDKNEFQHIVVISDTTVPVYIDDSLRYGSGRSIYRRGSFFRGSKNKISISEIGNDTLEDFKRKNLFPSALSYKLDLNGRYLFHSREERTELMRGGKYWYKLRARYPNSLGIFAFSRVGFNYDRTKAFVYLEWRGDDLAGSGSLLLLSKINDGWVIKKRILLWIS